MVFGLLGFIQRARLSLNPPLCPPKEGVTPIRFGILGAAAIGPNALILPARSHPEAIVYGVAARDKNKAEAYAKKHGIPKVFNSYQELIDCPEIDVIYNPLPNALHYEWTMKSLEAGKHVLLEKPSCDTTDEIRTLFEVAEKKGLVLMEAFHYRFHPATQRAKKIIDSGELGPIKAIQANLCIPRGYFPPDDIRFSYSLGGGAVMDMGCYTIHAIRYFTSNNPTSVTSASFSPAPTEPKVDRGTTAELTLPGNIKGTLSCDMAIPFRFGFIPNLPKVNIQVECEKGSLYFSNFVAPSLYHYIEVKSQDGKKKRVEKVYTFAEGGMEGEGEVWWTTYRHQLNSFMDRLKGRTPHTWIDKEDSISNMECIEQIYDHLGIGIRPKSSYVARTDN